MIMKNNLYYLKVVLIASSKSIQVFLNEANLMSIRTASLKAFLASVVRWPPAPRPAYRNASPAPSSSIAKSDTVETPDIFSATR